MSFRSVVGICLVLLLFPVMANAAPATFEQAKVELRNKVYHDRNQGKVGDLYCGCDWRWVGRSGGRIIPESCGYQVRAQPVRGERSEWEHILPAATFGRQRQCWQQGGRKNCTPNDPVFSRMEADMHNLSISVGELNADRQNFNFGVLPNTPFQHGACPFKVDTRQRTVEPPDEAKGLIARVMFYMHDHYGLNMSRQQQQLFMAWDRHFPVSDWERERNRRITAVMGHTNPYVTGERQWQLGQKPRGEGLAVLVQLFPNHAVGAEPSRVPSSRSAPQTQVQSGADARIMGNKRSGIFHLPQGCPGYGTVAPHNQILFDTHDAALAAGYRLAGNCS
jgi:deoxyribonuclease-1